MPKLFRKILCPIDFDDNSIAALVYARRLAQESGTLLYVLNVIFLPLETLEPRPEVSEIPILNSEKDRCHD
jgi:nucleotide-binding universal stress UspA family protein